jgi:hypothetical protein
MSDNSFFIIKIILVLLCLGIWLFGGSADKLSGITGGESAAVSAPIVHYQTIILK